MSVRPERAFRRHEVLEFAILASVGKGFPGMQFA